MEILEKQLSDIFRKMGFSDKQIEIKWKAAEKKASPGFSTETLLLCELIDSGLLSYNDMLKYKKECERQNPYLYLYEMGAREFGTWTEEHILENCPEMVKANCEHLKIVYPDFDGAFDIWDRGVKVEVKSFRATNPAENKNSSLTKKAVSFNEAIENGFIPNFHQIKTECADVFIFVGIYTDKIEYWVLSSDEVRHLPISPQHRNEKSLERKKTKNKKPVYEGQLFIDRQYLEPYITPIQCISESVVIKSLKTA